MTRRSALRAPAAAALALAGCGRRREPGRTSLWASDSEGENVKFVLGGYRRARDVDLQWLASADAHEKLLTAFAGDSLPDVMMVARDWLPEFEAVGVLSPLPAGPGVPPSLLSGQLADAHAAMAHDGRWWGVPWTLDTEVQYHRRDILADAGHAAPPPRLDDWRAMLRAVKRRGRARFAVLMQLDWPEHLLNIANQIADAPLRDRFSYGNYRSPGWREALALYKSLFDEGLAPLAGSVQVPDSTGDLARGFVAIYPSGAWTRADLLRRKLMPRSDWAVATLPGADGPGVHMIRGAVLGVAHDAVAPTRAWGLIRYLTLPETQLRFFHAAGVMPSVAAAWADPQVARDPCARVYAAALARPAPVPPIPEWPRIKTEVQAIAERLARGQLSVDEAATLMDARADFLLEKRRWLLDKGKIV